MDYFRIFPGIPKMQDNTSRICADRRCVRVNAIRRGTAAFGTSKLRHAEKRAADAIEKSTAAIIEK